MDGDRLGSDRGYGNPRMGIKVRSTVPARFSENGEGGLTLSSFACGHRVIRLRPALSVSEIAAIPDLGEFLFVDSGNALHTGSETGARLPAPDKLCAYRFAPFVRTDSSCSPCPGTQRIRRSAGGSLHLWLQSCRTRIPDSHRSPRPRRTQR